MFGSQFGTATAGDSAWTIETVDRRQRAELSGRRRFEIRHDSYKLDLFQPLSGRAIEEDRISFRFPNRREFNRPWTMQAE
jgi:hypothetical protein